MYIKNIANLYFFLQILQGLGVAKATDRERTLAIKRRKNAKKSAFFRNKIKMQWKQLNKHKFVQKVAKEFNIVQILCKFLAYKFDIGGPEVDKMTAFNAKWMPNLYFLPFSINQCSNYFLKNCFLIVGKGSGRKWLPFWWN